MQMLSLSLLPWTEIPLFLISDAKLSVFWHLESISMENVYKMIIFLIYINTPEIGSIAPEAVDRRAEATDTG